MSSLRRSPEVGPAVTRPSTMSKTRRPSRFWSRALPGLLAHVIRTTPWGLLLAGCAGGTLVLAVLAYFADHSPLDQSSVRITFLPAVAAFAFVPRTHSRPVVGIAPLPVWITAIGQMLLALPLLAVTCWAQLQLMTGTVPAGAIGNPPPLYPLLAQLTAWSLLAAAIAACCERTRYAALSGAIAVPVSAALIAAAEFTPATERYLLTPPAPPLGAAIIWYAITFAALALTGVAVRDQWHRYTRTGR
jgi:hypothetical protein